MHYSYLVILPGRSSVTVNTECTASVTEEDTQHCVCTLPPKVIITLSSTYYSPKCKMHKEEKLAPFKNKNKKTNKLFFL